MRFSRQQLERIAKWQPIADGFTREDFSVISARITPAIEALCATNRWKVRVVHDSGMENFYAISIRGANDPKATTHNAFPRVSGLLVQLSLLCPVAAVARAEVLAGEDLRDWTEMGVEQVIVPVRGKDEMTDAFLDAFATSGFEWASRAELSERLPDDLRIEGFCYGPEPWDRVFHMLFHAND